MHSILDFLWGALRAIGRRLRAVWDAIWSVLSSFVTWIVGAITYVLTSVNDWIESAIDSGISSVTEAMSDLWVGDSFPDVSAWCMYWLDLLEIPSAITLLVELLAVWLAARAARLLMVPVRALLELL